MGKGYFYYENQNNEVNKLFKRYFELDKKNPIEMGKWIHELCKYDKEVHTKIHIALATDLLQSGFLTASDFDVQNGFMERYNNVEQFFKLSDDMNELSDCLVSRYIGSVSIFRRPSDYVEYLSDIFCDRFVKHPEVNKIELIKRGKTYTEYIKK